jgi:hypothetical protein
VAVDGGRGFAPFCRSGLFQNARALPIAILSDETGRAADIAG